MQDIQYLSSNAENEEVWSQIVHPAGQQTGMQTRLSVLVHVHHHCVPRNVPMYTHVAIHCATILCILHVNGH